MRQRTRSLAAFSAMWWVSTRSPGRSPGGTTASTPPPGRRTTPPCHRESTTARASGAPSVGRPPDPPRRHDDRRRGRPDSPPPSRARSPGSGSRRGSRHGSPARARLASSWSEAWYQVSGSAQITRSAGFAVWAKNHQCHHIAANRASQRSSASMTRNAVHHDELADPVRVIQGRPVRDIRSAVMSSDRETLVSQPVHQGDEVGGHRTLGVRRVVRVAGRFAGPAVAAQIGAHDGKPGSGERRRDCVPRAVGTRMTVQQNDRRTGTAVPHAHDDLADVDVLQPKVFEHAGPVPMTLPAKKPSVSRAFVASRTSAGSNSPPSASPDSERFPALDANGLS